MNNEEIEGKTDNQCINEPVLLDIPNGSPIEEENILKDDKNNNLCTIKKKNEELESIQADLDDLVLRLNTFFAESQVCLSDCTSSDDVSEVDENHSNIGEKQDGPSEKELNLLVSGDSSDVNDLYLSDGSATGDINWENVGLIVQKHVVDLQKVQNLNQMTSAVVKRLKHVIQVKEASIGETRQQLDE